MIVKSVGVLSVGKMLGCLYALLGLLIGGLLSLIALAGAAAGANKQGIPAMLFGAGAVIVIPIFYGVIGFIGGIISAALYNVVASAIGGIEIELIRGETPSE
jgi:hypothetical protein